MFITDIEESVANQETRLTEVEENIQGVMTKLLSILIKCTNFVISKPIKGNNFEKVLLTNFRTADDRC